MVVNIDILIEKWELADARKVIKTGPDITPEAASSLLEKLKKYELCDNCLKIAARSLPDEGIRILKSFSPQELLRKHVDYDQSYKNLAKGVRENIQEYLAEARKYSENILFLDAKEYLDVSSKLAGLLEETDLINSVREIAAEIDRKEQKKKLMDEIDAALEAGYPTQAAGFLNQFRALADLDDKEEIRKLETEINRDEMHLMGKSSRVKGATEYADAFNLRRSLDSSTKYRLKYNAEENFVSKIPRQIEYLTEKKSKTIDKEDQDRIQIEIDTVNKLLSEGRKRIPEYEEKAKAQFVETVTENIENAETQIRDGFLDKAEASLKTALSAGRQEEKFSKFMVDRLGELELDIADLQNINTLQEKLRIKQKKRGEAKEEIDKAKSALSIAMSLEDLEETLGRLVGFQEEDPNIPGLAFIIAMLESKIEGRKKLQVAETELKIRDWADQWELQAAREELFKIQALCPVEIYDTLNLHINQREKEQVIARQCRVDFEKLFSEQLSNVDAESDAIRKKLDEWLNAAGYCRDEINEVLIQRNNWEKFVQKCPELAANKRALENVVRGQAKPDIETDQFAHKLAVSIVKDQPSVIYLLVDYWLKVSEQRVEIPDRLEILGLARECAIRLPNGQQVLKDIDSRTMETQKTSMEGKLANKFLGQLTPLLYSDTPNLQEAEAVLSSIPKDFPLESFPALVKLKERKALLSKCTSARIKFEIAIEPFIDDIDQSAQLVKTIMDEILPNDPENLLYKRILARLEFRQKSEKELQDKLDEYLLMYTDLAKLGEVKAFLQKFDSDKQPHSSISKEKIRQLQENFQKMRNVYAEKFNDVKKSLEELIDLDKFGDAESLINEKEKAIKEEFLPEQYSDFFVLKSSTLNKIRWVKVANDQLSEAKIRAEEIDFQKARSLLDGLTNSENLPPQKKQEVTRMINTFTNWSNVYDSAEHNLQEASEMMEDLRFVFFLQQTNQTKLLTWQNLNKNNVKSKIRAHDKDLGKINSPKGLPASDPVLQAYKCLVNILDSLNSIELSSPDQIPDDAKERAKHFETLQQCKSNLEKFVNEPPQLLIGLSTHPDTHSMIKKCEDNRYFREKVYEIKHDLENATFLAVLSNLWKKHAKTVELLKEKYHFKLQEVD